MRLRTRLLLAGYLIAELLVCYGVAQIIGWGWLIVILIAQIPIGVMVTKRSTRVNPAWAVVGGLLALPGLCSDVIALVLCIPVVQRRLLSKSRTWVDARVVRSGVFGFVNRNGMSTTFGGPEVYEGTVIYDQQDGTNTNGGHPKGQPPLELD